MTAVLEAPVRIVPPPPRVASGRRLLAVAGLLAAAVVLLGTAGLNAAPGAVRIDPVQPVFTGTAPQVTLPTYGARGMHVIGYEHGATSVLTLPIRNAGLLPMTVTSVALEGGVAPLLEVGDVTGLPMSVPPGATRSVQVSATLANCKFFHEREVQNYPSIRLGFTVLGRAGVRDVPFDRPLMVHSPMIVGCPDRLLDRQANDRSDLVRVG